MAGEVSDPPPPVPPLTPEQQANWDDIAAYVTALQRMGVRQVVLVLDGDKIGVRSTGPRVDFDLTKKRATITTVS